MSKPYQNDHDDLLSQAIESVMREPISDGPTAESTTDLVNKMRQAAHKPRPVAFIKRIRTMKTRTRIVLAASALIAVAGFLSWLAPSRGTVLAFDEVAKVITEARTATWKQTFVREQPGRETIRSTGRGMFLAPSLERTEMTRDGQDLEDVILKGVRGFSVTALMEEDKLAVVHKIEMMPESMPFVAFQQLRRAVARARDGSAESVERLDVQVIDGRRAEGFRFGGPDDEVTIWVAPDSSIPIRVETSGKNRHDGHTYQFVMSDFQIDVELEKSLFEVPSDYTVHQRQMDLSTPPMDHLVAALKLAAEHNNGVFPPMLHGEEGLVRFFHLATEDIAIEYGLDLEQSADATAADVPDEARTRMFELGGMMAASLLVVNDLAPKNDWHYFGKDVKRDTLDRPIFWYKPKAKGKYQVIFADLTVKELAKEELPPVPQS